MGGKLKVTSVLERGSSFSVVLPQAIDVPEPLVAGVEGHRETPSAKGEEQSYTVLCIEDQLSNLRLLESISQMRPGIKLLGSMQGSIGLDLAHQHHPDLILLDLNLPDVSGQDVLSRLCQSRVTADIPVIIISADATAVQIERLLAAGAAAYLTKPLDISLFLQTLDTLLQRCAQSNPSQ